MLNAEIDQTVQTVDPKLSEEIGEGGSGTELRAVAAMRIYDCEPGHQDTGSKNYERARGKHSSIPAKRISRLFSNSRSASPVV